MACPVLRCAKGCRAQRRFSWFLISRYGTLRRRFGRSPKVGGRLWLRATDTVEAREVFRRVHCRVRDVVHGEEKKSGKVSRVMDQVSGRDVGRPKLQRRTAPPPTVNFLPHLFHFLRLEDVPRVADFWIRTPSFPFHISFIP